MVHRTPPKWDPIGFEPWPQCCNMEKVHHPRVHGPRVLGFGRRSPKRCKTPCPGHTGHDQRFALSHRKSLCLRRPAVNFSVEKSKSIVADLTSISALSVVTKQQFDLNLMSCKAGHRHADRKLQMSNNPWLEQAPITHDM